MKSLAIKTDDDKLENPDTGYQNSSIILNVEKKCPHIAYNRKLGTIAVKSKDRIDIISR